MITIYPLHDDSYYNVVTSLGHGKWTRWGNEKGIILHNPQFSELPRMYSNTEQKNVLYLVSYLYDLRLVLNGLQRLKYCSEKRSFSRPFRSSPSSFCPFSPRPFSSISPAGLDRKRVCAVVTHRRFRTFWHTSLMIFELSRAATRECWHIQLKNRVQNMNHVLFWVESRKQTYSSYNYSDLINVTGYLLR